MKELLMHRYLLRKYFSDVVDVRYRDFICHFDVLFETFFVAFLKTLAGRQLIFDIVLNPQSSLMCEIAYIVLDEFKCHE